jgi:hypothetical protein
VGSGWDRDDRATRRRRRPHHHCCEPLLAGWMERGRGIGMGDEGTQKGRQTRGREGIRRREGVEMMKRGTTT